MMFFKKKPALIQIVSATTPRPVRKIAEIKVKAAGETRQRRSTPPHAAHCRR